MAKPGNDPQGLQSSVRDSVREKLTRFYSELSADERAYVEARLKRLGSIEVPSPDLVINQSNKTLVITNIGLALLWLSALVTLYTGWDYMRAGLRHMMD